jgi:hypothetical protein
MVRTEVEERMQRIDLVNSAFSLACSMFKNCVDRTSDVGFSIFNNEITFGVYEPKIGIIVVKSPEYFDHAELFSERYKVEVAGRANSTELKTDYFC